MALPQPRSRMALAAATRAAGVASLLRMIWTRILSADRVWLRDSERISVIDLGIGGVLVNLWRPAVDDRLSFCSALSTQYGGHDAAKSVNIGVIRSPRS